MANSVELVAENVGEVLLQIARRSLDTYVQEGQAIVPAFSSLPPELRHPGASFVTLMREGVLRGCIGSTDAQRPLAEDIAANAIAAASRDPRFAPVTADELDAIRLEVTVLTPPRPLPYANYAELLQKLQPNIDGVILYYEKQRGLLLPQVWRRIPTPAQFLQAICYKADIPVNQLQQAPPTVMVRVFRVQHFAEPGYREPGDQDQESGGRRT